MSTFAIMFTHENYKSEQVGYPQKKFQKVSMKSNYNKNTRRLGRLKQPGGSSCNQRR